MSPTDPDRTDPCFSPDEIQTLLFGRGPAAAVERLARHLPVCPTCAAAAEAAGFGAKVVSGFRRDTLPPPPSAAELAEVVARVSRLDRSSWIDRSGRPGPLTSVPERLGPYRLVELLGAGGMGVVYRAEDVTLHRFVAVKVVRGSADAGVQARFLSEARALAAVRHDNVVTVYHVGEEPTAGGTIPYLAMELLEGQTLRDWMAAAPAPSIEWIVQAAWQIASGLAFAHSAGLVHRDVKPANLWLEPPRGAGGRSPPGTGGRVKLLDFGLAHPPGAPGGAAAGTPAYMAPEQARGEAVDGRADLFGLGCVLYELCTGRLPFPARDRRWSGGSESRPRPVRELNPAVPGRLADLIERLLAPDRADRPASAHEVELELAAVSDDSSGAPTVPVRADVTVTIPVDTRPKRSRWLVPAAALVAVAIAVAALMRSDPIRPPADDPPGAQAQAELPQAEKNTPVTSGRKAEAPQPEKKTLVASDVIDDEWCRELSTRPVQFQLNIVLRSLGRLNPQFNWITANGSVEPEGVISLTVSTDKVSDIRPIQGLTALNVLRCQGSAPQQGCVTDLAPLSRLRLQEFRCANNPGIRDLSPIRLDRLEYLDASHTGVESLAGLSKAPLETLKVAGTRVRDLEPVRDMPKLRTLDCTGCPISDFEPLTAVPLRELFADIRADRDAHALKRVKTLERINGLPVNEFWKTTSTTHSK